jgi:adenylate cyclase
MNPLFCTDCEREAKRLKFSAKMELSMLFADIRDSTPLAESMGSLEFSRMIDRFYTETTHVLIHSYAVIDKLAGDQVSGYYLPGLLGMDFARASVDAAQDLLRVVGYGEPEGPWAPVGVGINTGEAVFGYVGSTRGVMEITALGDAANVAARLASQAAAGEILISNSTAEHARVDTQNLEKRKLELKGKSESQDVWVVKI